MTKLMLIDAVDIEETRIAITEHGNIEHYDFISKTKKQIKGNIYLGKITRIEPSLQAAFVEYGGNKQGFLPFSEIHPDYYQIPVEDRKRLLEEAEAEAAKEDAEDEEDDNANASDNSDDDTTAAPSNKKRTRKRRKPSTKKSAKAEDDTKNTSDDSDSEEEDNNDASDTKKKKSPYSRRRVSKKSSPKAASNNSDVIAEEELSDSDSNESDTSSDNNDATEEKKETRRRKPRTRRSSKKKESEAAADNDEQEVVSVSDNDDDEEFENTSRPAYRRYKIQEVMRPGQLVLVQVTKEERGNKGVSISTYVSLAGRYCVLMPNSPKGGGISRKIANSDDRKRLRKISQELKELRGMNAIIRTAGIDRTRAEIKRDYEYLIKLWNQVREDALSAIAPALVYEENDLIKRSIRDFYDSDIANIFVQGDVSAYRQTKEFMKMLMPSHAPRVKHYKDSQPIFTSYNVESQLGDLYNPTARLPSGGYLVINPTEALLSVDVNSGRSTNERNVEETAYKTNLEACEELARQLRLRNLGGLIVVDFIDMAYHKHRRNVERAMKDALRADRARIQVGSISQFGLMELSRQRMGASIEETSMHACPHCKGTGKAMAPDAIAIQLLRNLQSYLADYNDDALTINASQPVIMELCNTYRALIGQIEESNNVALTFELSDDVDNSSYTFTSASHAVSFDMTEMTAKKQRNQRSKNTRRSRGGNGNNAKSSDKPSRSKKDSADDDNNNQSAPNDANANNDALSDEQDEKPRKRRTRGSRGGRKKSSDNSNADNASTTNDDSANQAKDNDKTATTPSTDETEKKPSRGSSRRSSVAKKEQQQRDENQEDTASSNAPEPVFESVKEERVAEVLEDTPPPKSKRKGWWQRVMDA